MHTHSHTHSLFLACSRALPSLQPCSHVSPRAAVPRQCHASTTHAPGPLETGGGESPEDSSQRILRASAGQKPHHPSPRSRCTQPRGLLAKPASHLGHKTAPWGWCGGTLGQQEQGCIRKGAKPVLGRAESGTVPAGGHVGGARSRGRQCRGEGGVQRLGGGGAAADSARQLLSSA